MHQRIAHIWSAVVESPTGRDRCRVEGLGFWRESRRSQYGCIEEGAVSSSGLGLVWSSLRVLCSGMGSREQQWLSMLLSVSQPLDPSAWGKTRVTAPPPRMPLVMNAEHFPAVGAAMGTAKPALGKGVWGQASAAPPKAAASAAAQPPRQQPAVRVLAVPVRKAVLKPPGPSVAYTAATSMGTTPSLTSEDTMSEESPQLTHAQRKNLR